MKDNSVDSKKKAALLEAAQKERDEAKKKSKVMEMEAERLKQELRRLQEANSTSDNKLFLSTAHDNLQSFVYNLFHALKSLHLLFSLS